MDDPVLRALAYPDPNGAMKEETAIPYFAIDHIIAKRLVVRRRPDERLADFHPPSTQIDKSGSEKLIPPAPAGQLKCVRPDVADCTCIKMNIADALAGNGPGQSPCRLGEPAIGDTAMRACIQRIRKIPL